VKFYTAILGMTIAKLDRDDMLEGPRLRRAEQAANAVVRLYRPSDGDDRATALLGIKGISRFVHRNTPGGWSM